MPTLWLIIATILNTVNFPTHNALNCLRESADVICTINGAADLGKQAMWEMQTTWQYMSTTPIRQIGKDAVHSFASPEGVELMVTAATMVLTYQAYSAVIGKQFVANRTSTITQNRISGNTARDFLNTNYGGNTEVFRNTSLGRRFIDNLVDDVAMESKVGRILLTSTIELQILKDIELMNTPGSGIISVEWHFFKGITGIGPTTPLNNFLIQNSINIIIH